MNQRLLALSATVVLLSAAAFAQNPVTADSPFQVRYAANLNIGDSVVNVTNTGASGGNICVNVYTFAPDEQEISCCTCTVTPDGLASLSVKNSLINNTLTGVVPTAVVIKLVATTGSTCNAGVSPIAITPLADLEVIGGEGDPFATGLAAWGTTLHALPVTPGSPATTYGTTETAFTPFTISATEYLRMVSLCAFIESDGSGFGVCGGCSAGGLGATAVQ
jgi:hypothetical protein